MEHDVARERVLDGFGAPLSVDDDGGVGELVQDVEGFEPGRDAAAERLAERIRECARKAGIPDEVVAVEGTVAIASA